MEYIIDIGGVKMSQEYFMLEYKVRNAPITGQVSVPVEEWSDEKVLELVKEDLTEKKELIKLLEKIIGDWEGKEITVDV